jgi:hypothetical protein
LKNRVAAAFLQRSQDTELYPAGIGAEPQQAESSHFHDDGNGGFRAYVLQMHCLLLLYQTNLFNMDAEKLHNFIICRFMVSLCQSLSITPLHSLNLCKPFALWMPELFCFIHIEAFAIC